MTVYLSHRSLEMASRRAELYGVSDRVHKRKRLAVTILSAIVGGPICGP